MCWLGIGQALVRCWLVKCWLVRHWSGISWPWWSGSQDWSAIDQVLFGCRSGIDCTLVGLVVLRLGVSRDWSGVGQALVRRDLWKKNEKKSGIHKRNAPAMQ